MFEIDANVPEVVFEIKELRKQIPFATSRAINVVAEQAQAEETVGIFDRFHVRRDARIRTAVRRRNSTKRGLEAELTIADPFLIQHEDGETRKPGDVYPSLVHPVAEKEKRVGVVRGSTSPKALLKSGRKGFVATMKNGKVGVFRRLTKKRLPIELVFALEKQSKLHRLLKFGATVGTVVARDFEKAFGAELARAMRTAR